MFLFCQLPLVLENGKIVVSKDIAVLLYKKCKIYVYNKIIVLFYVLFNRAFFQNHSLNSTDHTTYIYFFFQSTHLYMLK